MWASEAKVKHDIRFKDHETIKKDTIVTVTYYGKEDNKYALWVGHGIYAIKPRYIELTTLISPH
jgi:hypothetical protein